MQTKPEGNKEPERFTLTDAELRLIISSLTRRIRRLVQVMDTLEGSTYDSAQVALARCNNLLYKLRMLRNGTLDQL